MTRSRADRDATLLAAIGALPASKATRRSGAVAMTTDLLPGALGLVQEAARVRRLSTAAYLRRCALAMACHDLDIPFSDALARDSRLSRETGFAVDDPDGTKFGRWEIERLVGDVEPDGTA